MSKEGNIKAGVPNVERALTVIELLSDNIDGLTLTQICQELGYPKNSVFRITKTLLDRNYISRDEKSKKFVLSRKMLSLAYKALNEHNIVRLSWEIMKELRDETGETILIATIMESDGIVLEQILGSHAFKFIVDPGTRFPLHSSAPGKAYLACLNDEERVRLCSSLELTKFTSNTISNLNRLYKELKTVRLDGFAVDREEEREGVICLGSPILNYHGLPIAALFLTGPKDRIPLNAYFDIGMKVNAAALSISNKLGWIKETLYPEIGELKLN